MKYFLFILQLRRLRKKPNPRKATIAQRTPICWFIQEQIKVNSQFPFNTKLTFSLLSSLHHITSSIPSTTDLFFPLSARSSSLFLSLPLSSSLFLSLPLSFQSYAYNPFHLAVPNAVEKKILRGRLSATNATKDSI